MGNRVLGLAVALLALSVGCDDGESAVLAPDGAAQPRDASLDGTRRPDAAPDAVADGAPDALLGDFAAEDAAPDSLSDGPDALPDAVSDALPDAALPDADAPRPDARLPGPDDYWTVAADFADWNPADPAARLRPEGPVYRGVVELPAGPIEFKFARAGDWAENFGGDPGRAHLPRAADDLVFEGENLRAVVPIAGPWAFEFDRRGPSFSARYAGDATPAEAALLAAIEAGEIPEGESPVEVTGGYVVLADAPAHVAHPGNDWSTDAQPLTATDGALHYAVLPGDPRVPYKFFAAGWTRDRRNPYVEWDGIERPGLGEFNSVALSAAALAAPGAHLEWFELAAPGGARDVFVWTPHGYAACEWLLVHDGNESITRGHFDRVLDEAPADAVAPLTVFVALADQNLRIAEYGLPVEDPEVGSADRADAYVELLADTVVPLIEARYDVGGERDCRGIIGASLGGLISVYAGWQRPEVWRRLGAQSGSFFWGERWMIRTIAEAPVRDYVFYLDSGEPRDNADVTRALRDVLREKGYPLTHVEQPGGQHDWAFWEGRFRGAVQGVFE